MAGQKDIRCVGPSYMLADRKSAVQRSINLRLREVEGLGEDSQVVLDSVDGLVQYLDLGADCRGNYATDTRWFVVAGQTLYELTSGSAVSRGTLATSSGHVSMKHGRDQLVIVDGANGYVLTLATNLFAQITDVDFRGSNWVEELDGYFIFVDPYTDQFYLTSIDDASTLDALDFSSADTQPDDIVTHRVLKRELLLLGTRSIEVWIDSGDSDFPFVRYNSTPIDVGIVGGRAAVNAGDTLFFVGQTRTGNGTVYVMQGHQPVRVSTKAVEEALQTSTDLSHCSMWTYQRDSAEYVGINAPGMSTTWVFDVATKQWHERAELLNGQWEPRRDDEIVLFDGEHYAIAGQKVYRLDPDVYTIGSDALVRERTWPHLLSPSSEPINYRSLEIACTTGSSTAGNITLEVSNNGGYTFGPPLSRSLGALGDWMRRVRWHFLGSARDRVFRLRCSDAVPLTIHAAYLDLS